MDCCKFCKYASLDQIGDRYCVCDKSPYLAEWVEDRNKCDKFEDERRNA